MKTLITAAIILSVSSTTYAVNEFDRDYYPAFHSTVSHKADKPATVSQAHINFWADNVATLERNSKPFDSTVTSLNVASYGSQPEIGSAEPGLNIRGEDFWKRHGDLLDRTTNPQK